MRPTRRLLWLLALLVALGAAAARWDQALGLWLGFAGVLAWVLVGEGMVLLRRQPPRAERRVPTALSLGEWHSVRLRLDNPGRELEVRAWDHAPTCFETEGLPRELRLPARGWAVLEYRIRPQERGDHAFPRVELLLQGSLGLLERRVFVGQEDPVRVYPNFREVSRYAMLALDNRLSNMGIHLRRQRGEGTEFHQLREFRQGDSLRQIDWKAVSRRRQLISREYREERDQRVLFLLDCGRRMHARDGELSHFDHALNAVLLLSYVALRQGDAVGLMTFSGHDRWVPPVKGRGAMTPLLNAVYDLGTSTAPSDYSEAARRLATRQRRRSLVILVTNLRDDDAGDLPAALAPLRRRHLVLLSSLREPVLERALEAPVQSFEDALRVGATHRYLADRKRAHELAQSRQLLLLDCEPAELPVGLVNKYLEIKRAGLL